MPHVLAASLGMALALLAQDRHPPLPLAIIHTWVETTDRLPAEMGFAQVEVLNTGQRTILAWGVKYVLQRTDGHPVPSSGFSTDSAAGLPEHRTMAVAPGQTVHDAGGRVRVPADALFSDVAVTFVIFDDDSALGDAREIAWHFARRRERQVFWQKMQTILDEATAHETESIAVLSRIRRAMDAETDPTFREGTYYNEILARMSASRMESAHSTPEGVLENIRATVSAQKANADAHANRR